MIPPRAKEFGELKGSIFIVKKDGGSTKLALVDVLLFSDEAISRHVAEKQSEARAAQIKFKEDALAKLQEAAREAESSVDELKFRAQNAKSLEIIHRQVEIDNTPDSSRFRHDRLERELKEYKEDPRPTPQVLAALREKSQITSTVASFERAPLEALVKSYPNETIGTYFRGLPAEIARSTSDADGHFTISIPTSGRFAIYAKSSREILNETETYFWLVWVSMTDANAKEIMLSNNNLATEHTRESVLPTPEAELKAEPAER